MNGNPTIWRCAVADHHLQIRGDCYSTDSELFLWPLPTYGDQLVEYGLRTREHQTLERTHARTHARTKILSIKMSAGPAPLTRLIVYQTSIPKSRMFTFRVHIPVCKVQLALRPQFYGALGMA